MFVRSGSGGEGRVSVAVFFKPQQCFLRPEASWYLPAQALIGLHSTFVLMLLPSCPIQVHRMIAEFKLIPGLNNLFDKLIWRKHSASALVLHGHNQNCDCSPVSRDPGDRWALLARSSCFKNCCWLFEISFFESRAETESHSLCNPIIGSHLGEGSTPPPSPIQKSLLRPSSQPSLVHLWAGHSLSSRQDYPLCYGTASFSSFCSLSHCNLHPLIVGLPSRTTPVVCLKKGFRRFSLF